MPVFATQRYAHCNANADLLQCKVCVYTCRVYTDEAHPEWCNFNYGSGTAIWNNSGDCAYLRDAQGNLVDSYCY